MTFTVEEYMASDGSPLRYGKLVNPNPKNNRALMFIPGLGGSVKGALVFLQTLLPEYAVIYGADLRGFGLNPVETPILHVQPILADLLAFHDFLGQQGHVGYDLAAISLGGSLSTLMLTAYKDQHKIQYDRHVVLAPAYQAHAKTFTLGYVIRNIVGRLLKGKTYTTYLPYGLGQITRNESILNDPQFTGALGMPLSIDFLLSLRALNKQALSSTKQLETPTLMFIPGEDLICDANAMRRGFNQIPAQKECREYPGLYHDLLLELQITEIAEEARQWLTTGKLTPEASLHPNIDNASARGIASEVPGPGSRV